MLHFSASLCRQLTTSIINDEKLSVVNLSFCQPYTKLVKFENLLGSKFYNLQLTLIVSFHRTKRTIYV